MQDDLLHAVRLIALESALVALLRDAASQFGPDEIPDSLTVTLDAEGVSIDYKRGAFPVGGEGL